jgi:hypothetical protein
MLYRSAEVRLSDARLGIPGPGMTSGWFLARTIVLDVESASKPWRMKEKIMLLVILASFERREATRGVRRRLQLGKDIGGAYISAVSGRFLALRSILSTSCIVCFSRIHRLEASLAPLKSVGRC